MGTFQQNNNFSSIHFCPSTSIFRLEQDHLNANIEFFIESGLHRKFL